MKNLLIALCLFAAGSCGAYGVIFVKRRMAYVAANTCKKHSLERCPFCNASLVKKSAQCKLHNVPEALCHQCRPELIAVFKSEQDWCAGHQVPESQCQLCGAKPSTEKTGKALCKQHGVPATQCPFCDSSLIESMGPCRGHKVPEALCSRCNEALIPGFKNKGDWCAEHNLPESQCQLCRTK